MKKILLAVIAIVVLGGGALAAKIVIDRPNDPQNFVNTAFVNSLEVNSAKFESTVQLAADLGNLGSGQLALAASGAVANATEYLPTLDYQIDLEAAVNVLGQSVSGKASGELKILDEVLYGQLAEFTVAGAEEMFPPEPVAQIEAILGKWYSLSFAKLKAADPEIAAVFEEQKATQLEMRENLKNLFATGDILLVKKMPIALGEIQPVEVVLNTAVLTSDAFLAEMEKMFTPSLPEDAENPFKLSEEQKAQIQQTISEIADKIDSTIILQIGKKDGILRGYSAVLNFDLAELGLPQIPSGTASIVLNSQNTEINEPQSVEAPTEFEEIDLLALVDAPTEAEEAEIPAAEEVPTE